MECRMVFLTLFIIEPDSRSGSGLRRRNKVEQTLEMIFYPWKYSLSDIQRDRSIPNRLFFGLKTNIHSKHESLEFLISTKREFRKRIELLSINLRNKFALWLCRRISANIRRLVRSTMPNTNPEIMFLSAENTDLSFQSESLNCLFCLKWRTCFLSSFIFIFIFNEIHSLELISNIDVKRYVFEENPHWGNTLDCSVYCA